jgi:hypothetical protein
LIPAISGVPEPSEWLLIAVVIIALAWRAKFIADQSDRKSAIK